jgi:hypothetical protein
MSTVDDGEGAAEATGGADALGVGVGAAVGIGLFLGKVLITPFGSVVAVSVGAGPGVGVPPEVGAVVVGAVGIAVGVGVAVGIAVGVGVGVGVAASFSAWAACLSFLSPESRKCAACAGAAARRTELRATASGRRKVTYWSSTLAQQALTDRPVPDARSIRDAA